MTLEEKLTELRKLTDQFAFNLKQYKSAEYDEANTRVDFIDKFFALLDWDVSNSQGYSEAYRDVIREDKVKIEGKQKAPDYSFRIGGMRKFFVEAKKPSVNIKDDLEPAFQVRRYGYTAKLPLSILTDFEEFAIFDTRIKPDKSDKSSVARIFYCSFDKYQEHFEFIYNTFSKNAILKGSFDKYVEDHKNKQGTSTVDKELLKLVEGWRTDLAKNIALRNAQVDIYSINNAVQKIIDRIIFLRIAEDKEIEPYGQLLSTIDQNAVYEALSAIFARANEKYNSGLFKQDDWLTNLVIDDKVFIATIKGLYYPECPYEFSILPIEILGNIYEQFLGKTIKFKNVKDGHTVVVEEKPEVRKAGGVYYTPKYIVDYIIQNTIGPAVRGKHPSELTKMSLCDPACGSGSFLVGAYQFLLSFHLSYYSEAANIKSALRLGKLFPTGDNVYRLTIEEKQRILVNNIFGVDIDPQAVEVTKLSLYLTLLENEGKESQGSLFKHSDLKLLPTLDENIKCGNSLIGTDFYHDKNLSLFDIDDIRKVNSFDWKSEFATIFRNGGFDFVVGNPPYIFARDEGFSANDKEYFYLKYSLAQYQLNTYIMFTEKGYQLLSDTGRLGFIIPNNWLTIETTSIFREFVLRNGKDKLIVNSYDRVFEDANIDTSILIFSKAGSDIIKAIVLRDRTFSEVADVNSSVILAQKPAILNFEVLGSEKTAALCEKIRKSGSVLSHLCAVKAGIKAYEVTKGSPAQTEKMKNDRVYHSLEKHDSSWIKYLDGVDVARYSLGWSGQFVKYGRNLAAPRNSDLFVGKRILVRQIPSKGRYAIHAALCDEYCVNDLNSMIVKAENLSLSPEFVLAVLNSRLMTFWFLTVFGKMQRKLFPQFKINELSQFPIVDIDSTNNKSVESEAKVVKLVTELSKTIAAGIGASANNKKPLEQKIAVLNRQIDFELYSLYGLTQEEIDLIESE